MLRTLSTVSFRNLEPTRVHLDDGVTVITGANGQGKTNLLEAISVLGNLRSFRGSPARRMATHGCATFVVEGEVDTRQGSMRLCQTVEVGPPVRRTLSVNGATVDLETYLSLQPVFVLSRNDTDLVDGAPEGRRAMLDRLAFFLDERHLRDLKDYRRGIRQRNAALAAGRGDREIEVWEKGLAGVAAKIVNRRRAALERWRPHFRRLYDALRGPSFPDIEAEYRGESRPIDGIVEEVAEMYRQRYHETRPRDRLAGFTLEGPHRHDLLLKTAGRSVRDVLSAGQVKTLAAALCMATLTEVEARKSETLPVLVDDVDAEIDRSVLARLVKVLGHNRQVVLSSAHAEVVSAIVPGGSRLTMVDGRVEGERPV
jgi:DNA replication and repair protein RecF